MPNAAKARPERAMESHLMRQLAVGFLLAWIICLSGASPTSAVSRLCDNWLHECARLYGWSSLKWRRCMAQPKAIRDCDRGRSWKDDYDDPRAYCVNWLVNCAELHGWGSRRWEQCMGQPGAIRDCSGDAGRYGEDRYGGHPPDLCDNWLRECARLYGKRTRRWYACMEQPGAIRDCGDR